MQEHNVNMRVYHADNSKSNDFQVNVVASSSTTQISNAPDPFSNSTCYSQQLVTLTRPNKAHLEEFIDDLQADPDTHYIPAFTTAFELFKQTPAMEKKRGWRRTAVHVMIVFFILISQCATMKLNQA